MKYVIREIPSPYSTNVYYGHFNRLGYGYDFLSIDNKKATMFKSKEDAARKLVDCLLYKYRKFDLVRKNLMQYELDRFDEITDEYKKEELVSEFLERNKDVV